MRLKLLSSILVLACVIAPATFAQEGHPLVGIWLGDWGPGPDDRNPVLLEMNWETTTLSGTINPGFPDAATIRVGILDSSNWTVHLEAEASDGNGNTVPIVIDGQLDNLGSANRTLAGTWRRGDTRGNFSLTRE